MRLEVYTFNIDLMIGIKRRSLSSSQIFPYACHSNIIFHSFIHTWQGLFVSMADSRTERLHVLRLTIVTVSLVRTLSSRGWCLQAFQRNKRCPWTVGAWKEHAANKIVAGRLVEEINTVSLSELDEPLINWWSISEHAYIAGLFSEGASGGYSCGRLGVWSHPLRGF